MMKSIKSGLLVSLITFLLGWSCTRAFEFVADRTTVSIIQPVAISLDAASASKLPPNTKEILSAVFRYQMKQCFAGEATPAFFLSYNQKDIPDLLASFAEEPIPVFQRSKRRQFERETADPGTKINVSGIDFVSPSVAYVNCSCTRAMMYGYSYFLQLRLINNVWKVENHKITGIS